MKKILIVVDMQNDFIDGSLGTREAQAIVPAVAEKIRGFDGPIFFTMDTHDQDYLATQEGQRLPVPHCVAGTHGWELRPEICDAAEGKLCQTQRKPAFGSVELPEHIRNAVGDEPFTLELVGLCTDICVVSNALLLKAAMPEVPISVDAACCAGVTPEKHAAALETLRSCQIEVR